MIYAFVNDNTVKKVEEATEEQVLDQAPHYQQIIPTEGLPRMPLVGWIYVAGKLQPDIKDVTPRQIRQALLLSGVSLGMIDAALNSLPEPTRSFAVVEWEYSTLVKRNRPLVSNVGLMLGWNDDQLDDLWRLAGTFE